MTRKHFLKWGISLCLVVIFFLGMKIYIAKWRTPKRGESASLYGGGYTDKYGNFAALSFADFYDGLRVKTKAVRDNDPKNKAGIKYVYGFEDRSGQMVIDYRFDYATFFSEGLAAVRLNGKWGYIDKKGEFMIPPSFEGGGDFSEGWASVELNGKWGYINKEGKIVIPPSFERAKEFSDGLASVKINGKWGYIDTKGEIVIQPQYYLTYAFLNGVARVSLSEHDGRMTRIDKTGAKVSIGLSPNH